MTFKQLEKERRLLRGVVAKAHLDLVDEARAAKDPAVAVIFWRLAGRMEGVMQLLGIPKETRRKQAW